MEKEFEEKLNNYFEHNGIETLPNSNKEKLKLLKKIVFNSKFDIDVEDIKHQEELKKGINDPNYLDNIQNFELNVHNGLYYIANMRGIVKEEKKIERKTKIKKFFGMK